MSSEIVRWILTHADHTIRCTQRMAAGGLELCVTYDRLPLTTQYCAGVEDAGRWADQIRQRWETCGGKSSVTDPAAID